MANFHLVFIPSPGVGHLFSAVEFAKKLVNRDGCIFITIFVMSFPFDNNKKIPFSSTPQIKFVHLTLGSSDLELLDSKSRGEVYACVFEINKPRIRDYISTQVHHLAAFLVDMFCTTFIDIANEFNVPTYAYFTSSAGFLGLCFHLQILEDKFNKDTSEFIDSDVELHVTGFSNVVPARVLPRDIIDKTRGFFNFINILGRLRETKGILVNTFIELESYAIKSLSEDNNVPQIYPVGPLLTTVKSHDNLEGDTDKTRNFVNIMNWLDEQPTSSVVLLCFGSMGCFESKQVVEIANALEHSGHKFLWALRRPSPKGRMGVPTDYENLDDVLPEGFLDRTSELGKVVGWVPQVEVLSHHAMGGFVSHCGWNSTLESIWCGVPVATWPLYAEQNINAFELIKELGLAVEITMDYNKDIVIGSDEIRRSIKLLMDDKDCLGFRNKVKEMSKMSKTAVEVDGSSYNSIGCFIEDLISS